MGWLFAIVGALFPRPALLIYWLARPAMVRPAMVNATFNTFTLPCLGFIFLHSGATQELGAAADAMAGAVNSVSPTSLIGAAFGGGHDARDALLGRRVLGVIGEGLAAVRSNTVNSLANAEAYRAMVTSVSLTSMAQKTAQAAKEGGFLGIVGTQVSAEERPALNEISRALA
jgi:hypothetical protein